MLLAVTRVDRLVLHILQDGGQPLQIVSIDVQRSQIAQLAVTWLNESPNLPFSLMSVLCILLLSVSFCYQYADG